MVQALELEDADFGGAEFKMLTDLLIFSRPDDLKGIHLAYLKAGANIIETNTFGATPLRLGEFDFSKIDVSSLSAIPAELDLKKNDLTEITRYLNIHGARIAKQAIEDYKALPEYDGRPLFVAGSIGPSNYVLSSTDADLKKATFAQIVDNFQKQVAGLIEGGADILLFETQQDILETKAALIGAQNAMATAQHLLPVMVQVTVDQFSKMQIFNTDIHAAYTAVSGMNIDVFGVNCNVGPELMVDTVKKMSRICKGPISVVPNAGQPISEEGKTCYKLSPQDMADAMEPFVHEWGVNIVGGCCGTSPAHIKALSERFKGVVPLKRTSDSRVYVSGPQEVAALDSSENLIRIGERLNVRGSKKVRDAVEQDDEIDFQALDEVAQEQVRDLGIEIIDICMDSNIVETERVLPEIIHGMTSDFKGVFCIDSFSVEALQVAIEQYPGRPIINSISLEEYKDGVSKLDAVLSTTSAHGPIYIALVNGEKGPGQTEQEKFDLADEIVRQCRDKYGVQPSQLLIDVNAYPIGSESVEGLNFCAETLSALPRIKAIHPDLKTSIGVGNLTNGLAKKPYMRKVLTSVFLELAREKGLDCAILNPHHYVPLESLPKDDVELARQVILDRNMAAFERLEEIALTKETGTVVAKIDYDHLPLEESICLKIRDGRKEKRIGSFEKAGGVFNFSDSIVLQVAQAVDKHDPLEFINDFLMKTMKELGDGFGRGEVSLPHLLKSADVMRHVMTFLESWMRHKSGANMTDEIQYKGVIVLGTVYQDVHSIGKDLAKTLLENYGYRVIDLGVQVPLENFIETAKKEKADAIGMSALLVQTSNHMISVARMLNEMKFKIPLLIGGAPVNHRHAGYVAMHGQSEIENILGDVFYCENGMDGVNTMGQLISKKTLPAFLKKNKERLTTEYQRAKGMQETRDKLLEELPRRKVSFKKHEPPREGYGIHRLELKLNKMAPNLDTKSLYSLNWKFGKQSSWEQKGVKESELEKLREEWMSKSESEGWISPRSRFALLPAQSDGDDVILYDPENHQIELGRIKFSLCIGKGQKDKFSVAQYVFPKSSGQMDALGLQITTAGPQLVDAVAKFKNEHDSESSLYLQGLGDRITEDLAEYIHTLIRTRAGLKRDRQGQRYSPGYAALTDLKNNKTIWDILKAQDIGVTLTDSGEFDPPSATAAVICFHPDASYS